MKQVLAIIGTSIVLYILSMGIILIIKIIWAGITGGLGCGEYTPPQKIGDRRNYNSSQKTDFKASRDELVRWSNDRYGKK